MKNILLTLLICMVFIVSAYAQDSKPTESELPAAGLTWPPQLPEALVSIESVSNGCGGGKAGLDAKVGDTSAYLNSNNPLGPRYKVSFREACKQHDAGYSGSNVEDSLNDTTVDYYTWNQEQVDEKFLADMRKLCDQQIPLEATVALADCKGTGGKTSFGAESRYNAVKKAGSLFWRDRPKLSDVWVSQSEEEEEQLSLTQNLRSVEGTWTSGSGPDLITGEFRGTLISRDQDSIVKGFAKVMKAAATVIRSMIITVDPDHPNEIAVFGYLNGDKVVKFIKKGTNSESKKPPKK